MKVLTTTIGLCGVLLASSALAANGEYVAKSDKSGDACRVTASVTSLTSAKGDSMSGVLFTAFSPDGDRLDVHCAKVVLKLDNNQSVFVNNMTGDDLSQCTFHEHGAQAGDDSESNLKSSAKFMPVSSNTGNAATSNAANSDESNANDDDDTSGDE